MPQRRRRGATAAKQRTAGGIARAQRPAPWTRSCSVPAATCRACSRRACRAVRPRAPRRCCRRAPAARCPQSKTREAGASLGGVGIRSQPVPAAGGIPLGGLVRARHAGRTVGLHCASRPPRHPMLRRSRDVCRGSRDVPVARPLPIALLQPALIFLPDPYPQVYRPCRLCRPGRDGPRLQPKLPADQP